MLVVAFFCGILAALQLPVLPSSIWLLLLPFLIFIFFLPKKFSLYINFPTIFLIGFFWVVAHGYFVLSTELPDQLQGEDLIITGVINNLPEITEKRTRFIFEVDQLIHKGVLQPLFPTKIRLNWYGNLASQIKTGERWQFLVKLKKPHGMLNPGSFDYEKWLFERKIRATGYVKKSSENYRLNDSPEISINTFREKLKNTIVKSMPNSDYRGIVLALAIGDKSQISTKQWEVFTATGTNHLVAISGLHIGLVAGAMFFLSGFIARKIPGLLIYFPYYKIAAFIAVLSAFFYAALAGFAIPTQRALIMICVVMIFMMINQRVKASSILSIALVLVLIVDPFSALSVGFWLSFIAVAAILYSMQNRASANSLWWKWGRLQWIVSVALIPALLFAFQAFSIISPLANIIAVPWVSFFVVPLVLFSSTISLIFPFTSTITDFLFLLTDNLLHILWQIMSYFSSLQIAQWKQYSPLGWTIIPAVIGVLLLLSPKGFPAMILSVPLMLPLFIVKPDAPMVNTFEFTLLDVGQGLAAVVQTKNHLLVFDTGPRFSSGFDTGEAVVMPYLRSIGISQINTLIISHGDNDHIGGMKSLVDNVKIDRILTSVPEKMNGENSEICLSGQDWTWDGVYFEVLNPESMKDFGKSRKSGNNRSCVLRVSAGDYAVLLTGDIEKQAEIKMINVLPDKLSANILVAPHHGSNTSSTTDFIKKVNPEYVLYPTGFRNRFGFPRQPVVNRYQRYSVKEANTAYTGAITYNIGFNGLNGPSFYRDNIRRFWHY